MQWRTGTIHHAVLDLQRHLCPATYLEWGSIYINITQWLDRNDYLYTKSDHQRLAKHGKWVGEDMNQLGECNSWMTKLIDCKLCIRAEGMISSQEINAYGAFNTIMWCNDKVMNCDFKLESSIFKVDVICIQYTIKDLMSAIDWPLCCSVTWQRRQCWLGAHHNAVWVPMHSMWPYQRMVCGGGWYKIHREGCVDEELHFCQWCNIMSTFKYLIAHRKWLWWLSIWSSMTYRNRIVCSITIHGPCKKLIFPSSRNLHTTNNIGGEFTEHRNVLDDLIHNTGMCAYISHWGSIMRAILMW